MSEKLNQAENAFMGLLAGGFEVTCTQSLNYLKNASQQNLGFTINPRVLYRGYPSNVLNMGACTMWQFAVAGYIKNFFLGTEHRQLGAVEELTAGFVAGVSSSLLAGPLELMMIQQQRKGGSIPTRLSKKNITHTCQIIKQIKHRNVCTNVQ
eukprot:c15412_g1_i2.p1 GENE.c15412_g1_i2~~c15412_g1_i2.p1  ORF type:complete len:152 (+),score=12.01 c15412_g1_i2:111-566(+)